LLSAGFVRVIEKDVTVGNDTVRKSGTISINIVIPDDGSFTASDVDSMLADISEIATVDHLNQQLTGKS